MRPEGKTTEALFDPVTDHNLYEFDLTLWRLLYKLAREHPELAIRQFQITPETVAQFAQAEESALRPLASNVLLSFQLDISEQTLTAQLKNAYNPWEDASSEEINAAYWVLLNRAAAHDADIARVCFGLSDPIIQAIRQATDEQIRYLAQSVMPRFRLRCTEQTLLEYLSSHTAAERNRALLKKLNHSLTRECSHTA